MTSTQGRKSGETHERFVATLSARRLLLCGSVLALTGAVIYLNSFGSTTLPSLDLAFFKTRLDVQLCPQAEALFPTRHREVWRTMNEVLNDGAFRDVAIDRLGDSIRIPYDSHATPIAEI